ncbi:GtrA family protein [Loigolactobacillus coryniformis]|uniref:GtrA family protein n=2 Tax=Loigolactobacillus TaxID=2767889 RepID=UPI003F241C55
MIKVLWLKYKAIIAYLFFGVVTTLVNIGSFGIMAAYWHWNYQVATVTAWILTVIAAYLTNKVWVFGSRYTTFMAFIKELSSFFFFRGLTLALELIIMYIGVSLINGNLILVKLIDNIVVVVVNYLFSKWYIFKKVGK